MIRITAKPKGGFFCCGVHHPPKIVEHADGDFTPEQIEELKRCNFLVVEELPGGPSKKPAKKASKSEEA